MTSSTDDHHHDHGGGHAPPRILILEPTSPWRQALLPSGPAATAVPTSPPFSSTTAARPRARPQLRGHASHAPEAAIANEPQVKRLACRYLIEQARTALADRYGDDPGLPRFRRPASTYELDAPGELTALALELHAILDECLAEGDEPGGRSVRS